MEFAIGFNRQNQLLTVLNKNPYSIPDMIVDEAKEFYLIHSMGLTKEQIKDMLPSEITRHCEDIIRKRIDARKMYEPDNNKQEKD
jgi:hypothetical protein